ncbi:metal ABC transporter substrate-binding protein [Carnobacterium sp. CS13]|uniref:MetQ/NlpA family ABC transporter substrate-binding protein n=2 Tax=unclassified Carnobacterium TaxID=257487 RepID=UPI0019127466|nr:MetQ/NlpA family ABC transporter substrate-binding protein [Carnobacterium sp. CS13]QQP70040.1 metal ABC transporter substrate-binding protein [Carnobacterium sp. CS13]
MKKRQSVLSFILITTTLVLAACGSTGDASETKSSKSDSNESQTIVIGAQASDVQIWEYIAQSDAAKEAGVTLEVEEVSGGPQLNTATVEGEVDVNAFQSWAYLNSFNEESGSDLTAFATTYLEPMGIYTDKFDAIDDVSEGSVVAIADNPSNASRGLLLLEAAGLITLPDDFDALGTTSDIVDNPKKLTFVEIDDTTGPRVLQDVDLVLIGNTVALEGELNVLEDSIFHEEINDETKNNVNILVTQKENATNEDILKLGELYHDEEVQEYIEEQFDGTKVPVKKDISYLED